MDEKIKKSVFVTLFAFPFTMVLSLVLVYVALYGFQVPFDITMKMESSSGKLLSQERGNIIIKRTLQDSVKYYRKTANMLKENTNKFRVEYHAWQDSIKNVRRQKKRYNAELTKLEQQLTALKKQKQEINKQKIDRLAKIFKAIDQNQIDPLYVDSLDDQTVLAIIAEAKEQQAAIILQNLEPKRAARLTSQYLNVK